MEVQRPVPKQPLGILLTESTVPLKDNTTPSTPAGLLLFPRSRSQPPCTNPSVVLLDTNP
ncbi:hypothetical protein Taro_012798 [Colocasia esculenta]|uniref:Uncharacterized protein n=1 Tax=Colocasia esculenta TaxID=4460 RepID=A0A843UEH7_COLES|nr:hypothetical protein [Colocasia esculenta]